MTEQERYLITFLNETFGHHESDIDSEAFAKRLIQRYPQILAEKVWEGNIEDVGIDQNFPLIGEVPMSWKTVQIFMKEGEKK